MKIFVIVREWSQDGHVQDYMYETEGSTKQHTKHVEVAGELFYNMSMMTTVVSYTGYTHIPECSINSSSRHSK